MVFFSDEANRASPEEQAELILRRHLSFFASEMEDFEGFIAYHGGDDNPFVKRLKELRLICGDIIGRGKHSLVVFVLASQSSG